MSSWSTPLFTVIGGAGGFGAFSALFRSGKVKEAQVQSDRLIDILEHRHKVDAEALKAADGREAALLLRLTALEAQVAQLQTVEQITTALNELAKAQNRLSATIKAAAPESVRWSD